MKNEKGFTLVELAIVLVIIGLLVGGVLQGQELIKQAEIRSQIKMLNDIKLGFVAFQAKYDALPGDMKSPERFFPVCNNAAYGSPGAVYSGNGDGMITDNENYCVWPHLFHSGLYEARGLKQNEFVPGDPPLEINFATISFPYAKWPAKDTIFMYFEHNSVNYPVPQLSGNLLIATGVSRSISPIVMYEIDSKIDDGKPGSGVLMADSRSFAPCYDIVHPVAPASTIGLPAPAAQYNLNENRGACDLHLRFK